ncbi:MAG TPA: cytochrome c-type biogenesis protein [Thermoanaerobaculia bacterium]|jgi:cytochrome c-type biogenesis protein CcmH
MKSRLIAVALLLLMTPALLAQLRVPDAAQFVGQPQGTPLTGEQLHRTTNTLGGKLRCPVCQGLSVTDSPAEMAVNMKAQVRELLERGYTEEQILKYFELSYGQFVLLEPKFEGFNAMVWLLPALGLLFGGAVVYFTFRRLAKAPAPGPVAEAPPTPIDDPYLARVRDLVSGGK